mmetsp:Transcript_45654/g.74444  ORF Transcript_45654/g.74444 Transcript_45654/m.74444 type:complete len:302 (-) Transcript_45654:703-1608(-)|eukprot:CAMPEP_0184663510 /NCGR_PEP_ID=MMETSP0308-20130426/48382_1 /TAXON_ID=38269 /ORGANISM="Gloeochaete witrockiana, Strain SAG 46.84" /LENGTH=301 /DNA_ID=CAMNT_0027106279 /DNA_START=182 /DNA_END=1087 /DNA_ORIENTATION=+
MTEDSFHTTDGTPMIFLDNLSRRGKLIILLWLLLSGIVTSLLQGSTLDGSTWLTGSNDFDKQCDDGLNNGTCLFRSSIAAQYHITEVDFTLQGSAKQHHDDSSVQAFVYTWKGGCDPTATIHHGALKATVKCADVIGVEARMKLAYGLLKTTFWTNFICIVLPLGPYLPHSSPFKRLVMWGVSIILLFLSFACSISTIAIYDSIGQGFNTLYEYALNYLFNTGYLTEDQFISVPSHITLRHGDTYRVAIATVVFTGLMAVLYVLTFISLLGANIIDQLQPLHKKWYEMAPTNDENTHIDSA